MRIQKEFIGKGEVRGFKYRQIDEQRWGFIYEVNTGDTKYYEVFKKRPNRRFGTWAYPGSKSFGSWAWCCMSLGRAKDRMDQIRVDWEKKQKNVANGS